MLELGIGNIQPVHARVEYYCPDQRFDTIIARAFTSLPRMFALTQVLRGQDGCLLAMKGSLPRLELAQLPADLAVRIIPLKLPFTRAKRHLIEIRPCH
jgi:16S rRNA (guanine527-N7)-methyltransferase